MVLRGARAAREEGVVVGANFPAVAVSGRFFFGSGQMEGETARMYRRHQSRSRQRIYMYLGHSTPQYICALHNRVVVMAHGLRGCSSVASLALLSLLTNAVLGTVELGLPCAPVFGQHRLHSTRGDLTSSKITFDDTSTLSRIVALIIIRLVEL